MLSGAGIGFRRDLANCLLEYDGQAVHFIEVAPENWMGIGGKWGKRFREATEKYPVTCHGLSLSLGSPDPLDVEFLARVKHFLEEFSVAVYSEHLSYTKCNNAHIYELLPIPFTEEAALHVAHRIREAQDVLERKIAIENVSYYTPVTPELTEHEFLTLVLEEADCELLLDVNNVYVNAFNHKYNAKDFLSQIPLERVSYIHMAGHEQRTPELIIDTHGEAIIDPVYDLLEWTLARVNPCPVLLERDFNFPEFPELLSELDRLQSIAERGWSKRNAA